MRATYKLGRDVITEFEAQNAGNSISGPNFKTFSGGGGGGGGMPGIGMSHGQGMRLDPRLHCIEPSPSRELKVPIPARERLLKAGHISSIVQEQIPD